MSRRIRLTLLIATTLAALIALFAVARESPLGGSQSSTASSIELLIDVQPYNDLDYGFSMAIPAGWRKIITADMDTDLEELEPGYAIGFESPSQGVGDRFADYILVEILPGSESGLFEFEPENRKQVLIDGHPAWFDTVTVDSASSDATEVNLTIYQAELRRVGYTVGLYAIGEPDRAKLMAAAFELLMRTFKFQSAPFSVS